MLRSQLFRGFFSLVFAGSHKSTGDLTAIKQIKKYEEKAGLTWETQQKLIQREVVALRAVKGSPSGISFSQRKKFTLSAVDLLACYEDDQHIHLVFELCVENFHCLE